MSEAEARGAAEAWHTAEESIKVSVQRGETIEELLRRFAAEESREYSEKRAADQQMAWRKFHEWKSKRMRAMSGSQIERMLKTGELAESAFSDEMWKLGFMYRDLEERPWLHSSAFSGLKDEAWNAWRREFNFAESDRFEAMNYEYTYERRNPQRD